MSKMRTVTYKEAIRDAMAEEMRKDENIIIMGEDIGTYCGAFGVTKGMLDEFGPERVLETPISEMAYVGAGVGAAVTGMRPIVEIMFSDFISVCYDQVLNQAAKMHFMFAGKVNVPMVIRMAAGGGTGAAAQHSQSLEQLYTNVPGLKVAIPSTPYDAKGLMKTAIRDNNPVVFLEIKRLYNTKGEVPEEDYSIPLGVADVKREGDDVSLITYGRTVPMCLSVAEKLSAEGINAEVIDLRTLFPIDREAIIKSVMKTHKAVVVHEAVKFGGFGGEIASIIGESEAFYYLDAPVQRVGGLYCPVPFNPVLEAEAFPTPEKIEAAIRDIL